MTTTTSTSRRSSSSAARISIRCSTRADGDFHLTRVPQPLLARRQRALVDLPWVTADQRHGVQVVRADAARRSPLPIGDIVITDQADIVIAVWVADCAPIVLIGAEREFAVVHAGWRGLAAGVLDHAFDAFSEPVVDAVLGPAIGPCCYEFGDADLVAVAAGVHAEPDAVRGRTVTGGVALDVPAAVGAGLHRHGLAMRRRGGCTGCEFDGFSHRVRRDPQRQVVAAWRSSVVAA